MVNFNPDTDFDEAGYLGEVRSMLEELVSTALCHGIRIEGIRLPKKYKPFGCNAIYTSILGMEIVIRFRET